MKRKSKRSFKKVSRTKTRLQLPDLDQAKAAVLNSLGSPESQRGYHNIGYWQDLGQALEAYSRCVTRASLPTTLEELLQLQHAHSTQIKRIGERCVSLWGKGS